MTDEEFLSLSQDDAERYLGSLMSASEIIRLKRLRVSHISLERENEDIDVGEEIDWRSPSPPLRPDRGFETFISGSHIKGLHDGCRIFALLAASIVVIAIISMLKVSIISILLSLLVAAATAAWLLLWRLFCEAFAIHFQIYYRLGEIRDLLASE